MERYTIAQSNVSPRLRNPSMCHVLSFLASEILSSYNLVFSPEIISSFKSPFLWSLVFLLYTAYCVGWLRLKYSFAALKNVENSFTKYLLLSSSLGSNSERSGHLLGVVDKTLNIYYSSLRVKMQIFLCNVCAIINTGDVFWVVIFFC